MGSALLTQLNVVIREHVLPPAIIVSLPLSEGWGLRPSSREGVACETIIIIPGLEFSPEKRPGHRGNEGLPFKLTLEMVEINTGAIVPSIAFGTYPRNRSREAVKEEVECALKVSSDTFVSQTQYYSISAYCKTYE